MTCCTSDSPADPVLLGAGVRRAGSCHVASAPAGRGPGQRARPAVPSCSRTATRLASSAIRCRRSSAATCATRTGSATCSATRIISGEKAAAEHDLAALHAIPRDQLDATDQLAYDMFEFQTKDTLRGLQPDLLALTEARPMNHFFGIHTVYPTFASGQGGGAVQRRSPIMRTT